MQEIDLMGKNIIGNRFIISGHRGCQSLYPENTLDAFQAAIELNVPFVELDLLPSSDGKIVIHHDFLIENRPVYSYSLEELKAFDVGQVNPAFPLQKPSIHTQIPLLSELFDMVKESKHPNGKKMCFNLEIKSDPKHPEYTMPLSCLVSAIIDVVKTSGFTSRVYYSSFDPAVLAEISTQDPEALIAFLFATRKKTDWIGPALQLCQNLKAQIFSPHESLLNFEVMQKLKQAKLEVIPWTVNDLLRFKELVAMGVDGVISDYPQRFLE
jgi:glycerophosphoryl diester phosphodiesterase